jgi:negative regulator of replication initiation
MVELRTIEIDWDIYKAIEAERRSFSEPSYVALRRLLKLPPSAPASPSSPPDQGSPWQAEGAVVPHGTPAKMEYGRGSQVIEGVFLDGKLVVNGQSFSNLSAAADAFAVTKHGTKTSLNGWKYWQVKLPGQAEWVLLDNLRKPRARGG